MKSPFTNENVVSSIPTPSKLDDVQLIEPLDFEPFPSQGLNTKIHDIKPLNSLAPNEAFSNPKTYKYNSPKKGGVSRDNRSLY